MTLPRLKSSATPPGRVLVLHPGDVACGERGDRLETLLGSCVAVILTDPRRTVGTMCHIVHATSARPAAGGSGACGANAMAAMHAHLRARSIEPRLCEAYVFGGGNMFPAVVERGHVGVANAGWVIQALARDGVRVLALDTGGNAYRRLSWTVGPWAPQVTAVAV